MGRAGRHKIMRGIRRTIVIGGLGLVTLLGYGISSDDARRMKTFCDGVTRWQTNPEFRSVGFEYCDLSSQAMRTHPFGISATSLVMALRSLPYLPENIKANPTSHTHYVNFTHGPLSAYLYLSNEQGVKDTTGMLEELVHHPVLSDDEIKAFLGSFNIHPPPITDAGAVQSVRSLLADVDPSRPFLIRKPIPLLLQPHIAVLLAEDGLPPTIDELSVQQEELVLSQLDYQVRQSDDELWRTKQVNDFLNGVWSRYGETYQQQLIGPMLKARGACRLAAPMLIVLTLGIWGWRRQKSDLPESL